ncbi:hypothetical protein KIW84_063112 [Lathyrus oleraceus]|uniref:Uncharacterized protein n=1 Tax=Pisum sativum TaxID=3888 RepID=A0A9D5A968_PEA|nr:hypothetical protein KIW84_063112 [Pisum sativum]
MTGDLDDKDENTVKKKDQSTDIVNIEDMDFDDVPIGQRLTPGITKRLKNRKGQAIESSSTHSKSLRKRASVGPTKRWSKVLSEEEGSLKGDGTSEEEENEEGFDVSDDEDTISNDED